MILSYCLISILVLVPAVLSNVEYEAELTGRSTVIGKGYNLKCSVKGYDPNAKDSVIVWYQEREVHQALVGMVEGRATIGRIAAACRTTDGKSVFQANSESVLPHPHYITNRLCDQHDFRIGIKYSGMQHIGEWWCFYTILDGKSDSIKFNGDLIEPASRNDVFQIRSTGGKIGYFVTAPPETETGKTGGIVDQPTTLQCPADVTSLTAPLTFAWSRAGGAELESHEVATNGNLTLNKVKVGDAGEYECKATASDQTEKTGKVELVTYDIPTLDLVVSANEYIGMVAPEVSDIAITVVTYARKLGGTEDEVVDSYTMVPKGGANLRNYRYILSFDRPYHEGKFFVKFYYYLTGVTPFPYVVKSQEWTIRVPFPVSAVHLQPSAGLSHIRAVEGLGTNVRCKAEGGGDPPEMLQFYKRNSNGQKEALGADGLGVQWTVTETPKKQIESRTFEVFSRDDNGTSVECRAGGENGTTLVSSLTLEVYWLPDVFNFSMSPTEDEVIAEGMDVTFNCSSDGGYPDTVNVTLVYGDSVLRTSAGVVTLYEVSDANTGKYKCKVTSLAGEQTKEIYLSVLKKTLSVRDSIGPLILVMLLVVAIVALIAAFFLFFMLRGDPEERKKKKKPKPVKEPRFRPPKKDKSLKKQSPKMTVIDMTDGVTPLDENGVNHVNPPPQPEPEPEPEPEPQADIGEITLEIAPAPVMSEPKPADPNGTIDEDKFDISRGLKFVDDSDADELDDDGDAEDEDESTNL